MSMIPRVLGDEAAEFARHFGCRPEGNVEPYEDPHEEFTRKNILFRAVEPAPAFAEARAKLPGSGPQDPKLVEAAIESNVRQVMKEIRERSPLLRESIESGRVGLVGGVYHLDSGRVVFLER